MRPLPRSDATLLLAAPVSATAAAIGAGPLLSCMSPNSLGLCCEDRERAGFDSSLLLLPPFIGWIGDIISTEAAGVDGGDDGGVGGGRLHTQQVFHCHIVHT